MRLAFLCVLGYLFGSIPFGVLVAFSKGADLRKQGSGNIGAANAIRTFGLVPGLVVLIGDMLKSVLSLVISKSILGSGAPSSDFVGIGICAILGHTFSCFLKFRGGKGVATTLGVFLFLSWKATLAACSAWVAVVAITRFASLGSLVATLLLPLFMKVFHEPRLYFFFSIAAFLFVVYKHRKNIERLAGGKENRLTFGLRKEEQL